VPGKTEIRIIYWLTVRMKVFIPKNNYPHFQNQNPLSLFLLRAYK